LNSKFRQTDFSIRINEVKLLFIAKVNRVSEVHINQSAIFNTLFVDWIIKLILGNKFKSILIIEVNRIWGWNTYPIIVSITVN